MKYLYKNLRSKKTTFFEILTKFHIESMLTESFLNKLEKIASKERKKWSREKIAKRSFCIFLSFKNAYCQQSTTTTTPTAA